MSGNEAKEGQRIGYAGFMLSVANGHFLFIALYYFAIDSLIRKPYTLAPPQGVNRDWIFENLMEEVVDGTGKLPRHHRQVVTLCLLEKTFPGGKWMLECEVNPGVESCKSIFFGVEGLGGRGV